MATKTRLQRLAAKTGRSANRLFKAARRRATDPRTHRKIRQSLAKTGRVLGAAGKAAYAAGSKAARAKTKTE